MLGDFQGQSKISMGRTADEQETARVPTLVV